MSLPPNWIAVRSDDGELYYWNEATNATSWEFPGAPSPPKPLKPQRPGTAETESKQTLSTAQTESKQPSRATETESRQRPSTPETAGAKVSGSFVAQAKLKFSGSQPPAKTTTDTSAKSQARSIPVAAPRTSSTVVTTPAAVPSYVPRNTSNAPGPSQSSRSAATTPSTVPSFVPRNAPTTPSAVPSYVPRNTSAAPAAVASYVPRNTPTTPAAVPSYVPRNTVTAPAAVPSFVPRSIPTAPTAGSSYVSRDTSSSATNIPRPVPTTPAPVGSHISEVPQTPSPRTSAPTFESNSTLETYSPTKPIRTADHKGTPPPIPVPPPPAQRSPRPEVSTPENSLVEAALIRSNMEEIQPPTTFESHDPAPAKPLRSNPLLPRIAPPPVPVPPPTARSPAPEANEVDDHPERPSLSALLTRGKAEEKAEEADFVNRTYPNEAEAASRRLSLQLLFDDCAINFRERVLVREGSFQKMNRDGPKTYQFFLFKNELLYAKVTLLRKYQMSRDIPLATCVVIPPEAGQSGNSFRIMSRQKSFYVIFPTFEEKQSWFTEMDSTIRAAQRTAGITLTETDCAPIWESNENVPECQLCFRSFGFLQRRRHCRNCGKCVCGNCSLEQTRIERIDPKTLFLVCNPCAREIKSNRKYGVNNIQSPRPNASSGAEVMTPAKR